MTDKELTAVIRWAMLMFRPNNYTNYPPFPTSQTVGGVTFYVV